MILPTVPMCPTAQARSAEAAATPLTTAPPTGVGLGTRLHTLPFQRRIRVLAMTPNPTAHAFRAEVAATPALASCRLGSWQMLGLSGGPLAGGLVEAYPLHHRIG